MVQLNNKAMNEKEEKKMTKKEQKALQKFASHIKVSTYLEFLDNFGGSRIKWLHVLYALKEDIDENIQRLEKYKN